MNVRLRKAVGGLGLLIFLIVYIWAAVSAASLLPNHWAARLIYYAVVGMAWGAPILPLIAWMNREP